MPALSAHALYARLRAALAPNATFQSEDEEIHPALVTVPKIGKVRAYLWTVTPSTGRSMSDEFKIQLTLPGHSGAGKLDLTAPHLTLLLGFSPEFGVFVGWEANMHPTFGSSPNVQVKEGLLVEARDAGWAVSPPRRVQAGQEVRVAFSPSNLLHYLAVTKQADTDGLTGKAREAFFLYRTPNTNLTEPPEEADEAAAYIAAQRARLTATRLSRDSRFSPEVKKAYGFACAICGIQMEVVESAHIIEVREEGSTDKVWNGIAMCAVHHKLFDAHVLAIRPTLEITVNEDAIGYLRARARDAGLDYFVAPYDGEQLTPPNFFSSNATYRNEMKKALKGRFQKTGLE